MSRLAHFRVHCQIRLRESGGGGAELPPLGETDRKSPPSLPHTCGDGVRAEEGGIKRGKLKVVALLSLSLSLSPPA